MDSYVVLSALILAAIYGLLAIGVSIIWSSLGMLNMAQGLTFSLAGYGAWLAAQSVATAAIEGPLQSLLVMAGGLAAGALSGLVVGAVAFIPLHDKPNFPVRSLIATLALSLLGTQALLAGFGPRVKSLPALFGHASWSHGDVVVTADRAGTFATAVALLLAVLAWMRWSRSGLELRAMMQNPIGAALVGIGVKRTALGVMAMTGAMTGLSAVLLAQTFFVSPTSGVSPAVKGLIIALAGGLGSVPGALAAAVLLGFTEALTSANLGGQYVLLTQFGVIFAILIWRPRGLGGLLDETRE